MTDFFLEKGALWSCAKNKVCFMPKEMRNHADLLFFLDFRSYIFLPCPKPERMFLISPTMLLVINHSGPEQNFPRICAIQPIFTNQFNSKQVFQSHPMSLPLPPNSEAFFSFKVFWKYWFRPGNLYLLF